LRREIVIIVTLMAVGLLLMPGGCNAVMQKTTSMPSTTNVPPVVEVAYTANGYDPATLVVPVGTKVIWSNLIQQEDHSVTSDTGLFDAYLVAGGGPFTWTFFFAGIYHYHDWLYPQVTGTVIVE